MSAIDINGVRAAAARTAGAQRGSRFRCALGLGLATLVAGAVAAVPARSSPSVSTHEQNALTRAQVIRAEVNAKYRLLRGRKSVVTEATTTGVVETLTLLTDRLETRVVPAGNGIYFAICSARATCPYPVRTAAWPAFAFLPRRQALELAVRAFRETAVSLVVVGLPTAEPTWVVLERDDLFGEIDAGAVEEQLARPAAFSDALLRALVDRLTLPRLYQPLPILPPPPGTLYAIRLFTP
jgi:hypothetical protein